MHAFEVLDSRAKLMACISLAKNIVKIFQLGLNLKIMRRDHRWGKFNGIT